jgi:hypothetical protein
MPKPTSKTINEKAGKVELLALRNTFLPDGTFVAKDSRILVDIGYAQRVQSEHNLAFQILN